MPKAILAMRTTSATLLVALLLFLLSLVLTTGTLGKVGSGGDGGDGGSGMGGTGKSGDFGGSGFGGTGGPSPFFTVIDDQNKSIEEPAIVPTDVALALEPESASADPAPAIDRSSPVNTPLNDALSEHSLVEQTHTEIALEARVGESEKDVVTSLEDVPTPQNVEVVTLAAIQEQENERVSAQENGDLAVTPDTEDLMIALTPEASSSEEVPQLAESISVSLEEEQLQEDADRSRSGLPERIQRPTLPPFQRIRPVERPALLPPRVQPMRI